MRWDRHCWRYINYDMKKNKQINSLGLSLESVAKYDSPHPRLSGDQNFFDLFMKLVLIFMGSFGALCCLNDGFTVSFSFIHVSLALIAFSLYFLAVQLLNEKAGLALKIAGALVFIVLILIFRETVAESVMALYTAIVKNYNTYYGIEIPVFETVEATEETAILIMMLPVCGWLSCATGKRHYLRYLLILLPCPLLAMVCGHMPNVSSLLLVIACFLGIFVSRKTIACGTGYIRARSDNDLKSGVYGMSAFLTVAVILLSAYLGYGLLYQDVEEKVDPIRYAVYNSSIRDIYAQLRNRTSVGGLSGGSINGRTSLKYDNTVHLVVKADTDVDHYTYLKGYVGVNYEGDSWSGLSEDVYDTPAYKELLKYDEDDILSLSYNLIQYSKMAYSTDIFSDFSDVRWYVTVPDETVGDGAYLCFPYAGLASSSDGDINDFSWMSRRYEEGLENVYDSYSFTGSSIYSYAESDAEEVDWYCSGVVYGGTAGEYLVETVELEEIYREFVYENYLDVPDSVSRLYEEYSAYADDFDTLSGAIKFVKNEVADGATYTLSPNPLPYGEDFIEYFMYESKEGYCVYFASAAVMIFRSLGIPARFVEGYLIPPVEANAEVSIEDSNAHAWVEVYVDGFGWLPVEVTPGYYGEAGGFTPEMNRNPDITGDESETGSAENETEGETEEETERSEGSTEETEMEITKPEHPTVTGEDTEGSSESDDSTDEAESGEAGLDESGTGEAGESGEALDETGSDGHGGQTDSTGESVSGFAGDGSDGDSLNAGDESGAEVSSTGFALSEEAIRVIEIVIAVILGLVIITLAFMIHRKARIRARRRRFNQRNVANSIINIYRELAKLSRRYYIPVNESAGVDELLDAYPLTEDEWEEFFAAVKEAAFSDHEMREESKSLALSVYHKCVRTAYGRLGFIKKAVFTVWDGYR